MPQRLDPCQNQDHCSSRPLVHSVPHLCNFQVPELVPGMLEPSNQHEMVAVEVEAGILPGVGLDRCKDELVALGSCVELKFASLRVVVMGMCRLGHLLLLV